MSVRYGLLTLLDREPMYGYQLRQEFEASTGSTWPLNVGQVYTTLSRLERDGFVASGGEGGAAAGSDQGGTGESEGQRVYTITDTGRAEVRAWFATPVRAASPPRDELAIKLALAVRTPGVDVRAVIQTQRAATIRALQEYTRAREAAAEDLSWLLVADSLIFAAEAEIRWLDHSETRLARHPRDSGVSPPPLGANTPRSREGARR